MPHQDEPDDLGSEDDDAAEAGPLGAGRILMTPEGHRRLREEQSALLRVERPRVVEVVSWAAGNGDRSENGDYQYGKKRLREIDRRLRYLGKRLRGAEIVDPAAQSRRDQVFFGATVTFVDDSDRETTVTIVGADEADLKQDKISLAAPIAQALLGARVGDERRVRTPRGVELVEVLAIRYPTPS
jgi:transcription elongation factor GreB